MIRRFASAGLVIAIVILLTGAACMACSDLFHKQPAAHSCCKKHNVACAATPVAADMVSANQSPEPPSYGSTLPVGAGAIVTLQSQVVLAPADSRPYSPPDLCLLNSTLAL